MWSTTRSVLHVTVVRNEGKCGGPQVSKLVLTGVLEVNLAQITKEEGRFVYYFKLRRVR